MVVKWAIRPGQLSHQRTQPGTITRALLVWHLSLLPAATGHTPPLMQHPVRHLHLDRGQLDHLMGIVGTDQSKLATATPSRHAACTERLAQRAASVASPGP
jgi:hypothetical protein